MKTNSSALRLLSRMLYVTLDRCRVLALRLSLPPDPISRQYEERSELVDVLRRNAPRELAEYLDILREEQIDQILSADKEQVLARQEVVRFIDGLRIDLQKR